MIKQNELPVLSAPFFDPRRGASEKLMRTKVDSLEDRYKLLASMPSRLSDMEGVPVETKREMRWSNNQCPPMIHSRHHTRCITF